MNLEQSIYQGPNLNQQLNLAPQLLNWLNLLQAPALELSAIIRQELESNPILESESPQTNETDLPLPALGEDRLDLGATCLDDRTADARLESLRQLDQEWREDYAQTRGSRMSEDDLDKHQFMMDSLVGPSSLFALLEEQLGEVELDEETYPLAQLIIGSLDRRGYLSGNLFELAEWAQAPLKAMQRALEVVQQLEPAGVGARDLRECLLLQLNPQNPEQHDAYWVVRDAFDLLPEKNLDEIAARLDLDREDVEDAMDRIRALDPQPGLTVCPEATCYVEPDVMVTEEDGALKVDVNESFAPHLFLSPRYLRLIENKQIKDEDLAYLRRKIRSGQFLIRGIGQRRETLLRVAQEIVRIQHDFFTEEQGELVPLTMNKVALIIGVHETTVSRALANKYMRTPHGLFAMKHFFKSGYRCSDGSALTPERVKELIAEMIDAEDEFQPVTDLDISRKLKDLGLRVARRTIAKYREEMDIPSSKERLKRVRKAVSS